MTNLQLPTFHRNGSSPVTMRDDLKAAWLALRACKESMRNTAPNMRDYYVNEDGPNEFEQASRQHHERLLALDDLISRYYELMGHAQAEVRRRERV